MCLPQCTYIQTSCTNIHIVSCALHTEKAIDTYKTDEGGERGNGWRDREKRKPPGHPFTGLPAVAVVSYLGLRGAPLYRRTAQPIPSYIYFLFASKFSLPLNLYLAYTLFNATPYTYSLSFQPRSLTTFTIFPIPYTILEIYACIYTLCLLYTCTSMHCGYSFSWNAWAFLYTEEDGV